MTFLSLLAVFIAITAVCTSPLFAPQLPNTVRKSVFIALFICLLAVIAALRYES